MHSVKVWLLWNGCRPSSPWWWPRRSSNLGCWRNTAWFCCFLGSYICWYAFIYYTELTRSLGGNHRLLFTWNNPAQEKFSKTKFQQEHTIYLSWWKILARPSFNKSTPIIHHDGKFQLTHPLGLEKLGCTIGDLVLSFCGFCLVKTVLLFGGVISDNFRSMSPFEVFKQVAPTFPCK